MRPSICQFISDAFYDGRLTAHETTAERSLNLQGIDLPNEGIVMIPAQHEGCSQKSVEEGEIIKAKYDTLLGQEFTDRDGSTRPIAEDDILVVTPYNVQVNYLRSILPDNAKVGTVDKFQGQEAPIVLISMVTSSAEDLPRNIEFLIQQESPECCGIPSTVFGRSGRQFQVTGNPMWNCRADETGQHILLAG